MSRTIVCGVPETLRRSGVEPHRHQAILEREDQMARGGKSRADAWEQRLVPAALEKLGYPAEGAASLPIFFETPWIHPDKYAGMTARERASLERRIPPGVVARQGTSLTHPSKVPPLIGIEDIRYLDASGLVRHRTIGDLMRYAAMTQGLDLVAHFGDFQPSQTVAPFNGPSGGRGNVRYSDEQLYALARYLYSLEPPDNPNPVNAETRRGESLFNRAGCVGCHPAPIYTNNKLMPAPGFEIPEGAEKLDDILPFDIGTDPTLATQTRRRTGYYKVPSLRGVWYRSVFGHNGQAASLEEWFRSTAIARRLRAPRRARRARTDPGTPVWACPFRGRSAGTHCVPENALSGGVPYAPPRLR